MGYGFPVFVKCSHANAWGLPSMEWGQGQGSTSSIDSLSASGERFACFAGPLLCGSSLMG